MRIALATVGTTGDVRPFIVLGRALAVAGHEVRAVTWPVHVAAFAAAGIAAEGAGLHADPARIAAVAEEAATKDALGQVAVLRDFHLQDGAAHLGQLRQSLAGHDLVLLHGIHALAHAAVLDLGCRWATAVFDPVLLPTREAPPPGMPGLGPLNRVAWAMLDRALARTSRPLDEVLAAAGSRQRGLPLFRARSPLLHLVACSPSIMRVPGDLPSGTHVTGAWLERGEPTALDPGVIAFLDGGSPPIVLTFGSMGSAAPGVVAAACERLVSMGRRVILQGGPAPGAPAAHVLHIGAVDHRALFPRAAVVVHHGGAGTTHTAAAAGVPQVVVAHVGDQRYWADRVWRLGIGPRPLLAASLTDEALAAAISEADTGPAIRAAARALAVHLAREDGVAMAIELVGGLVPSG